MATQKSVWSQVQQQQQARPFDPDAEIQKMKVAAGINPFVGPPTQADIDEQQKAAAMKRAYIKWITEGS